MKLHTPFLNFSRCTIEVWEWMSNFTPHFIIYNGCNYLSILGLKLNHISKISPWCVLLLLSFIKANYKLYPKHYVSLFWTSLLFLMVEQGKSCFEHLCSWPPENNYNWAYPVSVYFRSFLCVYRSGKTSDGTKYTCMFNLDDWINSVECPNQCPKELITVVGQVSRSP